MELEESFSWDVGDEDEKMQRQNTNYPQKNTAVNVEGYSMGCSLYAL